MDTHVKFSKLHKEATVPSRGSEFAAGYDLYACTEEKVIIPANKTVKIGTGMAIQPPHGYFGAIFARSGLATKQGLRPANCVGESKKIISKWILGISKFIENADNKSQN